MELYAAVRRSVYVEGLSERAAARRFGLARETVRTMLRYRRPPGYRRAQPVRRPKLDAFTGIIDQILREDQSRPKKQRHTAKRIGERLRAEYGFTGGDTIVKAYVRAQRLGGQEMFVPLAHPPGDAQADFGEALVVIAGVECKAHDLVVDLPHSDDGFVQAFPAETTEAFCDGHNAAFGYFGGVPRRIVYDNTKLAVARILGDGTRQRTQVFCELQSHYLFADRFGRPGKGNDKGKAELGHQARAPLLLAAERGPLPVLPQLPQELGPPKDTRRPDELRPERPHQLRRPRPRHPEQPLHVAPREQVPVQGLELPDGVGDGEEPPGRGRAGSACGVSGNQAGETFIKPGRRAVMEHLRAGERLSPASGSPATWLCRRVTSTPRPFNDDHQRTVGHVPVGQSFPITSFMLRISERE